MTATGYDAPTLAPFGRRFGAYVVDWLIAWGAASVLFWAWDGLMTPLLIATLVFAVLEISLTSARGWTIGKRAFDLEVRMPDGTLPSAGAVTVRFLGRIPGTLALLLGYLWCLWDPQQQTWHDKFSNTHVLYVPGAASAPVRGGAWQQQVSGATTGGAAGPGQPSPWVWEQPAQPQPGQSVPQPGQSMPQQYGQSPGWSASQQQSWQSGDFSGTDPWASGPSASPAAPPPETEATQQLDLPSVGEAPEAEELPTSEERAGLTADLGAPEGLAGGPVPAEPDDGGAGAHEVDDGAWETDDEAIPAASSGPEQDPSATDDRPEAAQVSDDAVDSVESAREAAHDAPLDTAGEVTRALDVTDEEPTAPDADATQVLPTGSDAASQTQQLPADADATQELSVPGAVPVAGWSLQDQPEEERATSAPGQAPPGSQPPAPDPGDPNMQAISRAPVAPEVGQWLEQVAAQVDARLDRINPDWREEPQAAAARVCAFGMLLGYLGTRYPHMGQDLSRVAEAHPSFSSLMTGSRLATLEQISQSPPRATAWLGPLVGTQEREKIRLLFD